MLDTTATHTPSSLPRICTVQCLRPILLTLRVVSSTAIRSSDGVVAERNLILSRCVLPVCVSSTFDPDDNDYRTSSDANPTATPSSRRYSALFLLPTSFEESY